MDWQTIIERFLDKVLDHGGKVIDIFSNFICKYHDLVARIIIIYIAIKIVLSIFKKNTSSETKYPNIENLKVTQISTYTDKSLSFIDIFVLVIIICFILYFLPL